MSNRSFAAEARHFRDPLVLELAQQQAIAILLQSKGVDEAASKLGVRRDTVQTWLQDASFRAAVRKEVDQVYGAAVNRLAWLMGKAVGVIEESLDSDSETIRLRAAGMVLAVVPHLGWLREFVTLPLTFDPTTLPPPADENVDQLVEKIP